MRELSVIRYLLMVIGGTEGRLIVVSYSLLGDRGSSYWLSVIGYAKEQQKKATHNRASRADRISRIYSIDAISF